MKYLAFNKSVAVIAAAFISNYAIANSSKLTVEHVAPHVVELPQEIAESDMKIVMAIAEKFEGYLTDAIPSPIDFFDPQPKPTRRQRMTGVYDHAAATNYSVNRTSSPSGPGHRSRSVIELPCGHPDTQLGWRA